MSKIENENVEIQAVETTIEEVKPEGFFKKAGNWIAKHKTAVAITAAAGTALAFVIGAVVKNAKADQDDTDECLEDDVIEDDFEMVESDE